MGGEELGRVRREQNLNWVLVLEQVDDVKSVLDDADGHELREG